MLRRLGIRWVMARRKRRKNPHAVALGRLGGAKGGKKAAANLTPKQRRERARRAALARWKKRVK